MDERENEIVDQELGGTSTSWSPTEPLEPGTSYSWFVEETVAFSHSLTPERTFFTGPACSADSLKAPTLLKPVDGAVISDPYDIEILALVWDYPDPCVPDGYGVDLSTSPDFKGPDFGGGTGNPATTWLPGITLPDCTRYYWRIVAGKGIVFGPYSQVRTFRVASQNCPAEEP